MACDTRRPCIGDLSSRITLENRTLTEPLFANPEYREEFTLPVRRWAKVVTTAGKTLFNGVNTDVLQTHEIWIRYDPTVTAETWVKLNDGRRLDILQVEDIDEDNEWLRLLCKERGVGEAAKA